MSTIPIYSPTIPYLGSIPGGLTKGAMIRIQGRMMHGADRFSIYLQNGPALRPRDDAPLHISVRPHEHAIVRNILENQNAGTEERHGGCPIVHGQQFVLLILADTTYYKMAINGSHFAYFNHRLPMNLVQFISIDGAVTIDHILREHDSGVKPQRIHHVHAAVPSTAPPYPVGTVLTMPGLFTVQHKPHHSPQHHHHHHHHHQRPHRPPAHYVNYVQPRTHIPANGAFSYAPGYVPPPPPPPPSYTSIAYNPNDPPPSFSAAIGAVKEEKD